MPITINIDDLVNCRVVESTRVEFTEAFNPDQIIHTICAFANDIDNIGGGYILVGVKEDKGVPVFPIKGIPINKIDGIIKKLRGYCRCIEPFYEPVVEPVIYNDVYIIIIWASGGLGRPYQASKSVTTKQSNKYYHIRKFANTVIASNEEEKELFYISSNIPFDDRPNLAADVSDLDIGLLREHLKETNSSLYQYSLSMDLNKIADSMQLLHGPSENVKPRNVGILMFSEHIDRYFRYARIEVVDIPDPTGTNMVEKVFTGPIQRQLRDANSYIKNYILKEVVIKLPDKAEALRIYNYPYVAIEEILANAVYHRSYQINEPITVRITPEEIEITSFPGFDRSITNEAIANFDIRARAYRNRRIGDFLKELHLIEGRNTGFPNARRALKENGSGDLKFDMNLERDYLAVKIPIHPYFINNNKSKKDDEYIKTILKLVEKTPLSLTELSKEMGYKGITKKLKNTVLNLVSQKELSQIIEDDSIKYKASH